METCSVCLEPLVARAAPLPCGHSEFCRGCISAWARAGGRSCPVCRAGFGAPPGEAGGAEGEVVGPEAADGPETADGPEGEVDAPETADEPPAGAMGPNTIRVLAAVCDPSASVEGLVPGSTAAGVTLARGDRVLVTHLGAASGIYMAMDGGGVRALDMLLGEFAHGGTLVFDIASDTSYLTTRGVRVGDSDPQFAKFAQFGR